MSNYFFVVTFPSVMNKSEIIIFVIMFDANTDYIISLGLQTLTSASVLSPRPSPLDVVPDRFPYDFFLVKPHFSTCNSCPWSVLFSLPTSEDIIFSRFQCRHLQICVTFLLSFDFDPLPLNSLSLSPVNSCFTFAPSMCGSVAQIHRLMLFLSHLLLKIQLSDMGFLASTNIKMTSFENS